MVYMPFCRIFSIPFAPSIPMPVSITPMPSMTFSAMELNSTSTEGICPLTFSSFVHRTICRIPERATRIWKFPGAINTSPRSIKSPSFASRTRILQSRSRRSAYIFVKPSGICCVTTMPGVFSGSSFSTLSVASVPPVDAPMAMINEFIFKEPFVSRIGPFCTGAATIAGAVAGTRTFATDAILIFSIRFAINAVTFCLSMSGFRTKSTAPAESASNTLRFSEETSITGTGYFGISCFTNSSPVIFGISTSSVTTSGRRFGICLMASNASTAEPTISNSGNLDRLSVRSFRNNMLSSTTKTLILFCCISKPLFQNPEFISGRPAKAYGMSPA